MCSFTKLAKETDKYIVFILQMIEKQFVSKEEFLSLTFCFARLEAEFRLFSV
jgi:hypothetical protein